MQVELKNNVFHLSGRLDEFADFEPLKGGSEPLRLHLGKVSSINSVGVRKFLAFTLFWSPRRFEFIECTPEFIANINVIPQMLGKPADPTQVKSFYVPFGCDNCKRVENVLLETADVKRDAAGELVLPTRPCGKCGEPFELEVESNEYFQFLGSR